MWWKFMILLKIHNSDEDSSLWWKFIIVMKIGHCEQNSSFWWNSSLLWIHHLLKIQHCYENLWLGWKFIIMIEIVVMKVHHRIVWWELLWWRLINLIKIINAIKNHPRDEILLTLLKTYCSDDSLSDEKSIKVMK